MNAHLTQVATELRAAIEDWAAATRADEPPGVRACFVAAAARATDPKEQLVYRLDAKLIRHPELLATDDSYPGFAAWIAEREADNRRAREAK